MNQNETATANPPRILVADDDEALRTGLATWLQRRGCHCTCANQASVALDLIRSQEFDALIADIHMPGNERLQFVEAVPETAEGLPVILLTGNPTVETAARSVRLLVFAYLVKPADLEELLALVHQATSASRQARAVRRTRQRLQEVGEELRQIEASLAKATSPGAASPMNGFLRVILCNIASSIVELERCTPELGQCENAADGLKKLELISALRHTVNVLEKTRQNFKSKDLGALRHQLNDLLQIHE